MAGRRLLEENGGSFDPARVQRARELQKIPNSSTIKAPAVFGLGSSALRRRSFVKEVILP